MKKVSLLILVSLILLMAFASCDMLPPLFGEEPEPEHVHDWMEATCEAPKTCACGATEGEKLPHTWTEATCSSPKVCTFCNATEGTALNHNWVSADCETPATCSLCGTTSGEAQGHLWISASCDSAKHCANCNTVEGEPLEHVWVEATCLTPKTCTLCQVTEGPALGHTDETVPGYPASCTENGLSDGSVCTVCGVTTLSQQIIPATGHTASDWIVDLEPNCTELGSQHKECTVCQTTLNTQSLSSLGHVESDWITDLEATCDVKGSKHKVCTVCGVTTKTAAIPVLGHVEGTPVVENNVAPTCTDKGSYDEVVYCATCGDELARNSVEVDALGHTMSTATCQAPSTCSVCGHIEGTVVPCKAGEAQKENDVAPKCEEAGSYDIATYCVWCNAELSRETFSVDALGHDMAPATCQSPATCKNGCGKTEGQPLDQHTVVANYIDGVLMYTCAHCDEYYIADQALIYDGTKMPQFVKNGDPTITVTNGEYVVQAGTQKSQYMLYFPSNSKGNADMFKDFTGAKNSVGVLSFKFKAGDVTDAIRFIVMTARDNPSWDANGGWNGNSMDILQVQPNGDGTYTINGKNITSNAFATVSGDEWVDVKMFMQLTSDGMFNISYYVNGVFCNVYSRDLLNAGDAQTIKDLMIQCVYVCGWTEAGTGWMFDDFAFGYTNDAEWVFDDHKHTWADASCTAPKTCTACGITEGEALGHELVDHAGQAPSCTEKGWEAYQTCNKCDFSSYKEIAATGHNYGSATCDQAATCSVCGFSSGSALGHEFVDYQYNNDAKCELDGTKTAKCIRCDATDTKTAEGTALEHNWASANCASPSTCTLCGKTGGEPDKTMHNKLTDSHVNGVTTYSCATCGYSFKVDIGDYMDGSSYDGMTCNAATNNNVYTTNPDKPNYPALVDGHYEFIRTEVEAGVQKQVQVWLPTASGSNKFAGFSAANNAVGYLSFKLDVYTDYNFEMKLVDASLPNDYDVNGDGVTEYIRWTEHWGISAPVFSVGVPQNGKAAIVGFGKHLTSVDVNEDNFTGWLDVDMRIALNPETDTIDVDYYLGGQYIGSASTPLTIITDAITGVYLNSNNKAAGTGYRFDDFAFGYTAHKHDLSSAVANGILTYSCECGASYRIEEFREWNGDGSDSALKNVPNGNVTLTVNDKGQYEYLFKPATDVAPDFSAAGTQQADGWYEYTDKGYAGGQLQMWMPSNNRGEGTLEDFSCENNAVGVISFNVKSSLTRHPDWDTALTFSVGKPRNASDWNDGGSWNDDSINVFTIEDTLADGATIKGGLNGTNINFGVIPAGEDGWTEWFNVMMVIEMTDNGYLTIYYYINGEFVGSDSRDLNNPGGNRTLNPKKIEALQISGWTYAANTGIVFDDFYFGYTVEGHNTLDGKVHKLTTGATCGDKSICSCGWEGYTTEHDFTEATCGAPATCKGCGMTQGEALTHNSLTVQVEGENVKYYCADCNKYYLLDGGMHDIGDISDPGHSGYVKEYDGKVLSFINDGTAENVQHQIWVPGQTVSPDLAGFTNANNATGFLSFTINSKDNHNTGIEFKVNANRNTDKWDNPNSSAGAWSDSSVGIFKIAPHKDSDTTVALTGYNGAALGRWTMTGTDGWTGEMNVVIKIQLKTDNTVSIDYYINGEYFASVKADMVIWTYDISSLYVNGRTNAAGEGYILSNLYFGYTLNGLNDAPVVEEPEEPFYKNEISKDEVENELLKAIVTNKIKQWDQSSAHNNHNGTPVYVIADRNGEDVQALYFSKTTPWVGDEGEQFSEFRVDVDGSKKATGLTFSYKANGSVEKNDRYTFTDLEGKTFQVDSYVQIKTPANHPLATDNYPELQNTEFVFDGEWHDVTVVFPEPLEIINVLMCLYHFQGELLVADLEVQFAEEPFYTEEIAKESVSSSVLQTVVTNKIKQWDQSSAHNSHEGTPVFVKADMNGTEVTGVYFSKTTPWVGDEGEQFSEFRVNVDSSKKATGFSFVYKVEGTVDENKGKAEGGYDFKDLEGNVFTADAYVQIKTPANHPLAGDNYPELSGTDFILDGEWHTMTYTFATPLEITNMLFNFYHFQGELIIAELEVSFVEECQHTNTTTTKVDATCSAEGSNKVVCNDCGVTVSEETLPVVAHNMLYRVEGEGVVVSCAYECGEGYSIDKGYYTPGTDASLLTPLATNHTAGFTSIANGRPEVSEDGYLVFARKEGYTGLGQVQLHYRAAAWNESNGYFPDFSAAAGANGVLEFKINPNLDTTGNLRVIVSERVESGFGWGTHSITLLTFNPATADGKINVTGWGGNALATLEKGEDGYTGWLHVRITIELSVNEKGQNIGLVKYYFNGEHVGTTHSALNTLVSGRINNLYITSNHTEVGTGYMLDDLVFGYTTTVDSHEHSYTESVTAPTCTKAGFTTFTCECGESYTGNEVAALGHDEKTTTVDATCLTAGSKTVVCNTCGETLSSEVLPATGHTLSTVATEGKVSVLCAGCDRTYACDTSYVYDGANQAWNWSQGGTSDISLNVVDGEYVISANSEIGSQYMLYVPSSNRNSAMHGFTGEANALGVVSFRVKTNAQNYVDAETGKLVQPGTVRFILMEARNSNSNWVGWSDNSVDVLAIQPNNDGTYKVHGNSMTSTTLTTIAADEWLDVQMIVRITSAQTMTIDYYLNDTFCGSFTKDFNAENYGMRLVNNLIESLYICGWTQGQGTGVVFDDLYIGYTAFGHWTFDDNVEHVVTEATSCTAPATCTCGWVGDVLPHDMTEASCAAPATCKTCGFSTGEALKHNYTTLVNNGTVKYLCEDCMLCYSVETGTLSDGNNPSDNVYANFTGAGGADFNGNGAYPALVEGADGNKYFQYLKAETTGAKQIQIWLPASGGKGLQGFTADANNVGFFSLDFNANMDHNCEWKFVDFSSDAGRWTAEWNIDNPFFRMTTPADGKVELRGFNGVAFATVDLDENNYTGWMNLAFMITLDAEQDLVIVDYYLNGQYKATMSAALTTKTNGICAIYMNGNTKEAGSGYMVDNIAFGYGSFSTHEHTWTNATCTTAKTCSGCGMVDGEALGHDFDVANCTSPKTCAICDATEGEALGHDMQPATCSSASKCSRCSHTEGEALDHADEDGNFKCDTCSTKMLPADGTALTIPQALAIAELGGTSYTTQKYYITGIVTGLYNTQYGNFYIEDEDGNQICIYGLYSADGNIRYDAMSYKPVNGDEVTVYTVLGMYNTTKQGKNAWLDEVVAHEHNYSASVTAPTCVASGYTTYTCSLCSGSYQAEETEALGHTTDSGECERCGLTIGGAEPVIGVLATFDFGANGSASHNDGSDITAGKTYTAGNYTLKMDSVTKVYGGARDAKGNSCLKLGTSKLTGSLTFTVPEDVTEVVIYVAGYKAATSTNIKINDTAYTVKTTSNNGDYTAITIDTTTVKTITFTTVTYRCMINTIEFKGVVA